MSGQPPAAKLFRFDSGQRVSDGGDILCNVCCLSHSTEDCPLINTGIKVADAVLPSKAILTLPDTLECKKCDDGKHKIIAKAFHPKGTQFGPLDAPKSDFYNSRCSFILRIFEGESSNFLDTTDETQCNWMSLVPFDEDVNDRNCICYQLGNEIFFTAIKDIPVGDALTVGYSPGYSARLHGQTTRLVTPTQSSDSNLIPTTNSDKNPLDAEVDDSHEQSLDIPGSDIYGSMDPILNSFCGEENEFLISCESEEVKEVNYDFDPTDTIPSIEMKRQHLTNRVGAVLALDEWKCKFCYKVCDRIVEFADHLTDHYKRVGSAKTEKSRLQRVNNDPVSSQNDDEPLIINLEPIRTRNPKTETEHSHSVKTELKKIDNTQEIVGETESERSPESNSESVTTEITEALQEECDPKEGRKPDPAMPNSTEQESSITNPDGVVKTSQDDIIPEYPYFCDLCVHKRIFNRAEYIIRHLSKHSRENYCFVCKKKFPNRDELKIHNCTGVALKPVKVGNKNPQQKCRFCQETFRTYSQLRHHVKGIHCAGDEAFHRCGTCSKLFCTTETYKNHSCKKVRRKKSVVIPVKENPVTPAEDKDVVVLYQCEICYETFPRLQILENHLRTHGYTFACAFCSKGLAHSAVKSHMAICEVIQGFSNNSTQILKCPKCVECFDELDSFRYHVVKHSHPSMCPSCNLRFQSVTGMRAHKCVRFECDGCSNIMDTLIDLKKHINSAHGKTQYFCFECALPFVTHEGFAHHKGCEVKNANDKTKKPKRKPDDGEFVCETCGVTYTKWNSLKTHRYTHMERRFVCDVCGKAFHRREILLEHQFVHREAQFECPYCQKKFKSKKSLEVHGHTHFGIKRFPCNNCDKSFTQKINLANHQATHLPPEEKGYACKYCEKKFASREYLGFHVEAHEKGKHQVCDLCSKAFVKPRMLVQHKKTAHGLKNYLCEFCHLTLRQRHSLTRHLKNRHAGLEETWSQEGYIDSRFVLPDDATRKHYASRVQPNDEDVDHVEVEIEKETKTSLSVGRKQILATRTDIGDPLMNQNKETEIEFIKYKHGESSGSTMLLVEVEEGGELGELVFTLEDSQETEIGNEQSFNEEEFELIE